MNAQEQLIDRFYRAFTALDTDTMAACYAEDATFDDEAFSLNGRTEIAGMWRMLATAVRKQQAAGSGDWKLAYSSVRADTSRGQAHWEAYYLFSATNRQVHNIIDADFVFNAHGLIAKHRDRFDFWRWSRQALGTPGLLLGWSPFLKAKVRQRAADNLRNFLAAESKATAAAQA
jgi:hypothetical protein